MEPFTCRPGGVGWTDIRQNVLHTKLMGICPTTWHSPLQLVFVCLKDSQMADLTLCIHSSPAILEWTYKMDMRPHCAPRSTSREPPCYNMASDSFIFYLAIHCRACTSPWPPFSSVPVFSFDLSTLYECFAHIQRMATKNQSDKKMSSSNTLL